MSKSDERQQKILRALLQKPENKKCADCSAKGPVYACTTFSTFVCTTCSGIHREFEHRVKSISMASFKPEEIKALQEGGNQVAAEKWLANWDPNAFPEPNPGDQEAIRRFIQMKYRDRRWVAKTTTKKTPFDQTQSLEEPKPENLSKLLGNNIPPIQVQQKATASEFPNFASFNTPQSTNQEFAAFPPVQTQPRSSNALGDLESIFSAPIQSQSTPPVEIAPHNPVAPKKTPIDLQQQLGQLYQQQAAQNQFLMQQRFQQQQQQSMLMQMNAPPATSMNGPQGPFFASTPATPFSPTMSGFFQPQTPPPFGSPPQNQVFSTSMPPFGASSQPMFGAQQNGHSWNMPEPSMPVEVKKDPFAELSPFASKASTTSQKPPVNAFGANSPFTKESTQPPSQAEKNPFFF